MRVPVVSRSILLAGVLLGDSWAYALAQTSSAQLIDGGVILRVDDDATTRCVNGAADAITFHLVRMVSQRRSGWLQKDQSVGLLIETSIEGATAGTTEKISFPRSFLIDVRDYRPGIVFIPVEQKLLSRLQLRQGNNVFTSVQFDFKLISTRSTGPLLRPSRC
jgi:hypothetical protein